MGSDAARVAGELEAALAARLPSLTWTTERYVGQTPVDVAGEADGDDAALTLVELEWRRADSADNTVTLFRHLDAGEITGDVSYHALTLDVDPPKRGGELPDDWRDAVGTAADRIANRL